MGTTKAYIAKRLKTLSSPKPPALSANNNNNNNDNRNTYNNNKNNNNTDNGKSASSPVTFTILQFQEANLTPNFNKLKNWTK